MCNAITFDINHEYACLFAEATPDHDNIIANGASSFLMPQHCRIPFLYHNIYEYSDEGSEYFIPGHDIKLKIPNNAVELCNKHKVCIEVGVTMYSPYRFPQNFHPISPLLWINLSDKDTNVKKTLQITLPHCLADQATNEQICLLRAEIDEADASCLHSSFTVCQSDVGRNTKCETFETSIYSGIFCLAQLKNHDCINTDYCLAQVNVSLSPTHHEYHFYALFNLATHKRVSCGVYITCQVVE